MLDLNGLGVDEIAIGLSDQTDYERRWLFDPRTGEIALWASPPLILIPSCPDSTAATKFQVAHVAPGNRPHPRLCLAVLR